MSGAVFIDLTEALLSSTPKRVQYYGIARVVVEIGKEAAKLDPNVRFVVFSFGSRDFYEVKWHKSADGGVFFELPNNSSQRWFRTNYGGSFLLSGVATFMNFFMARKNRRSWEENATGLSKISISDGVLFSAARPKLIVDMMKALERDKSRVAIVPLLHDFMPLHQRLTKRFRRFDKNFLHDNRFVIERSQLIIANSHFTAEELGRFAGRGILPKPGPVEVVQLVHQCPDGTDAPEISLPPKPYLLTVGLNLGRKNIEVVFEALLRLQQRGLQVPHLVVAGAVRKRLKRYIEQQKFDTIRDRIATVANPNQTDLVRLYTDAMALVIPSRIEGWGLPAGEAMWCGTPAICSTATVLHEVCGDLGLYFDPDDPDALADIVNKLGQEPQFREDLRHQIAEAKPRFRTWKTVTTELIGTLREL